MPHVAWFPRAIFLLSISSCLFVYSTSEVKDCPGYIKAPNPLTPCLTEVGILLRTFPCIHHSLLIYSMYLQYSQVVSLGLVSLQILFGEMASWLVCSTRPSAVLSNIRNKSFYIKGKMLWWQQHQRMGINSFPEMTHFLSQEQKHTIQWILRICICF